MAADPHPKIGSEHASAMLRQGLRELRGALYPESNVAQQPEYGLYGTMTPGEVAESRRSNDRNLDEEPSQGSILGERLRAIDAQPAPEQETRDQEREVG